MEQTGIPLDEFSCNFMFFFFFEILLRKLKFNESLARITGTLHDVCTFVTISGYILCRARNGTHKSYIENQNEYFILNNFLTEVVPFMRKMWKNMVKPDRSEMTL
jgi:hypothetical protein